MSCWCWLEELATYGVQIAPSTQWGLLLFWKIWKIAGSSMATCVGVRSWKLGEVFQIYVWEISTIYIYILKIYVISDSWTLWIQQVSLKQIEGCTDCILSKFCQSTLRWSIKRTNSGCCMPNDDDIDEEQWRLKSFQPPLSWIIFSTMFFISLKIFDMAWLSPPHVHNTAD